MNKNYKQVKLITQYLQFFYQVQYSKIIICLACSKCVCMCDVSAGVTGAVRKTQHWIDSKIVLLKIRVLTSL